MPIKQLLLFIFILFLYGCQGVIPATKPADPLIIETETLFPTFAPLTPTAEALPLEQELWKDGPHANTFDIENASNTYCARCHSPLNWDPAVVLDAAQVVPQGEWRSVSCEVCHEGNDDGYSRVFAFWNQETREYERVTNSSDLCVRCHTGEENHNTQIKMGNSAHVNLECVACHEPHGVKASCSNSGCHAAIRPESSLPPATPTGGQHPNNTAFCGGANCHPAATQAAASDDSIHGAVHAFVSCIACHDASGMPVGPSPELEAWVTFSAGEPDGIKESMPSMSHDMQAQVDCNRCHFDGNTSGLPRVTGNEFRR